MNQSRIEYLAGYRWAEDVTRSSIPVLRVKGGKARLLKTLEFGMREKPSDYAEGVKVWVQAVADADPNTVEKGLRN